MTGPRTEPNEEPRSEPRKRRRWLRRVIIAIAIIVGIVAVTAISGLVYLSTDAGKEFVRRRAIAALEDSLAGGGNIGRIEGSLFGDMVIHDIVINDASGQPAITIARAAVKFDLWPLTSKSLDVTQLALSGVTINVTSDEAGVINLTALTKRDDEDKKDDDGGGGGFTISVKDLTVVDARVVIALHGVPTETITALEIGPSELALGDTIALVLGQTTARLEERGLDVAVRATVTVTDKRIAVRDVVADVAGASLQVASAAIDDGVPTDIRGSLRLPASAVSTVAPTSQLIADSSLAFSGEDGALEVNGTVGAATLAARVTLGPDLSEVSGTLTLGNVDLSRTWRGLPSSQLTLEVVGSHGAEGIEATLTSTGQVLEKPIDKLIASASMANNAITASLEAASGASSARAKAVLNIEGTPRVVSSSLSIDSEDLRELAAPWLVVAGDAHVALTARGSIETLAVTGTISSRHLEGFGASVRGLRVKPDLVRAGDSAAGRLEISSTSVVSGSVALDGARVVATSRDGRVASVSLSGTGNAVAVDADASVTLTAERIAARINNASGRYQRMAVTADGGVITWTPATRRLEVADLSLVSKAGELTASADVNLGRRVVGKASVAASAINLAEVSALAGLKPPLAGTASLTASIDTRRSQRADVTVSAYSVRLPGDLPVASGSLTATLRGRELVVTGGAEMPRSASGELEVHLLTPRDALRARDWQRLDRSAITFAEASAKVASFAPFTHLHPEVPRRGTVEVTASQPGAGAPLEIRAVGRELISARLDEPTGFDVTVGLEGKRVAVRGEAAVAKRASVDFTGVAELRGPWFAAPSYQRLDLTAVREAQLAATNIDVDWWSERYAPDVEPSGARAQLTATVVPATKSIEASATLELPRGGPRDRKIRQSTTVTALLAPRQLDATLAASFAGKPHVEGEASVAFGWRDALEGRIDVRDARSSARLAVKKLPLVALREVARTTPLASDTRVAGTLSASATFSGSARKPRLSASASIDGAVIADVAFASLLAGGSLRDDKLDFTITGDQSGGGRLAVHATSADITRGADTVVDATVAASKFDLGFLRVLVPERAISGLLSADLSVRGTRAAPVVRGDAHLEKGSFNPGAPLYTLRNADVRAKISGTSATVKGEATSGRGTVKLDAKVALANNQPSSLELALVTKKLPLDTGLIVRIDSTTTVTGKFRDNKWQLAATVEEAVVNIPDELSRSLHPTSLPGDIVFADEEKTTANAMPTIPTEIVLTLVADDSILVRGGIANAVIGADLKVRVRQDVRVDGTVRVDQGWLEIIGRRYDVRTGEVSFDGGLDPALSIELAHEFQAMTLFIAVGGVASNPVVEFRSDPAQYDDSELLSFVLGASPEDPTGDDRSVANRATGVATSYLAGQLSGLVTEVTPIDVLRIDTDDKSAERIALGKWITSKLLVAYRHRFAADPNENTGELTFEYRFLKRWLLEGYVGQLESGADVLWIRRF